jgi:hypothetical protein
VAPGRAKAAPVVLAVQAAKPADPFLVRGQSTAWAEP